MLGAYKKHPQACFLHVEDCFLLSDNADASHIFKRLDFELINFLRKMLNTGFILLCKRNNFFYSIGYLLCS